LISSIFITGIGTGVGKTLASAIVAEALYADYWKPIQAGFSEGTDSEWVRTMLSNPRSIVHPETYKLKLGASPYIASIEEGIEISLEKIFADCSVIIRHDVPLVIEGAGGLMVPLNEKESVLDLAKTLNSKIILVSRNYLGSINHSLLTAMVCRQKNLRVIGWIFNDEFMDYEEDIVRWSGYPKLGSVPKLKAMNKAIISAEANKLKQRLLQVI
jgi:dethiobiotin synthetase